MDSASALDALLACPRCDTQLEAQEHGHYCKACKVEFPQLDGIPFLFSEPAATWNAWRGRINHELARLTEQSAQIEQEIEASELPDTTRKRLEHLRFACNDQQTKLRALMASMLDTSPPAARPTYLALRTRLPTDQGLNTYYQNLHRDWAWGNDENARSCELVCGRFPGNRQRVLILGAGAGRLACDLHENAGPEQTVALDFNPLLLGIANRITNGNSVSLWEFPIAPKRLEDCAVLNDLARRDIRPGLSFVLADALRPPFVAGSFDVVVTPWLVDILPVDFPELTMRINLLLKSNGCWINFGSLAFPQPAFAQRYSLEECTEIVQTLGFAEPDITEDEIPYLNSPHSRHGRREQVVTWCAHKTADVRPLPRHSALPEWLVTGREPVPLTRSFELQAASTRIHAFVMSMIDGRRSIRDMARLMEDQRLMQAQEAEGVIREFLMKMHDDSQRSD